MRINIIGNSGCGKTTLGRELASEIGSPFYELDDLHWGPNWTERPVAELRGAVKEIVEQAAWVIDGNYEIQARDLIWPRTQLVLWLDFSLPRTLFQLLNRTTRRALSREKLWTAGNTENLREAFFSKESLFVWAIKQHGLRRRNNFSQLCLSDSPPHHRLRTPLEREVWRKQFRSF